MITSIQKAIKSPLRLRFLLYFIVLTTVPVLLLGAVSLSLIDVSHRKDISSLELQLIDQKTEEIEKFLADTMGVLEFRFTTLAGLSTENALAGETDPTRADAEAQNSSTFLTSLHDANSAFKQLFFVDRKGREQARYPALSENTVPQNFSLLPAFNEVVDEEGAATYVSDVHYTLHGPMVTMAAPVRTLDGDIVRVLIADVSLSDVVRSISGSSLGLSGGLALVDASGRVIAHHKDSIVSGSDVRNFVIVQRILGGSFVNGLGTDDRYISGFHAQAVVGAGKKIAKTNWAVIAEWPLEDADAIINSVRNQVMLLTLASILAVLLLAPFVTNRLIYPINVLKEGVANIEQGHFEKQVSIETHDELEELGAAFNRMGSGLKRLQELKNEFVFIAAHELRAPVTAIKGFISLIFEGDAGAMPTKKMEEFLLQIRRANEGLVQLVDDLLDVARSEAGKIEINVRPVDMSDVVEGVLGQLAVLAKQKSITLTYGKGKMLPLVLADVDKLREVITNFVSNAIKYTLKESDVSVSHELEGNMLITHIKDHGVGISEEAQKKLFEKFYRIKAKGTEDQKGTGLGLWITKQLIEKMGGTVWVVSEEGKGSIFSFALPIAP